MFVRNCPDCGKELSYSAKCNLTRAIKSNNVCGSCVKKGKQKMLGKKHSAESRRKIAEALKGKPLSEERRRKISIRKGGSGELNIKWSGMTTWAIRVKERDNYICQHCHYDGLPHEMDAHHIIPKSKFPQYAYDISNGQTLCRECHRIEHFKKPNYPWGN